MTLGLIGVFVLSPLKHVRAVSVSTMASDETSVVNKVHLEIEDVVKHELTLDEDYAEPKIIPKVLQSEDAIDVVQSRLSENNLYLQWPVSEGGRISSEFGPRWGTMHNGLDICCDYGIPILASESGIVVEAEYDDSMGNYVKIDHGNNIFTIYMHNSELLVEVGDEVNQFDEIALSGSTGDSTGTHCHIGIIIDDEFVDPELYLER